MNNTLSREKAQTVMQQEAPVTPLKKPETSQSTLLTEGPVPPSFPVSDISDSNGGSDHNRRTDESIVTKYLERAEQTDKSFVNISFEIFEDEKETSYQPSSSVESEDEDEDLDDFDEEEVEDYILDMSLQLEPENTGVPVRSIADRIFHVDDGVDDDVDMEEGDDSVLQEERNYVAEKKALCFEQDLLNLAKIHVAAICNRKACSALVTMNTKTFGTAIRISWVCNNGHQIKTWDSQPVVRRMRVGDILLSAAILTSGNNYDKVNLMFRFFGCGITSKPTHYKLQTSHICPVIGEEFEIMVQENLEKYIGKQVVIAGDGRMDSPGHSAQYCTYTLMEHDTKDILTCIIIDKRMTGLKSTAMELEGLRRGMKYLLDSGVTVVELVTDASTTVAAMMRKDYPAIKHSFDVWHGAKNFGKKIGAISAESRNKELRPWVPHLINHFWYCSRTASGDEDIILGKWRGTLHHVTNVHEWIFGDGAIEPRCDHGDIDPTDEKWLEPGGSAHMALTKVMLDTRTLHKLHHYVNFRHTGELENLHEHILMYCAKRFAYTYPAYKARNYLAMLDYMKHKDRTVVVNKNGETRLHRCYSKRNGTYGVYAEKVPKTYSYMGDLLQKLISSVFSRTSTMRSPVELTPTDPRKIKRSISGISPPPTKSLMETKKSRFGDMELSSMAVARGSTYESS